MANDDLTKRLKQQYADRSKTLMDSLRRSSPQIATTTPTPPAPGGTELFSEYNKSQYPEWYSDPGGSFMEDADLVNAAGASLWSFVDTFSWGTAGYLGRAVGFKAEDYIDFEDPAAKWGSAIGSFVGFVGPGGPFKIGKKIVEKAFLTPISKQVLKGTAKKTVGDAVKVASEIGRESGLSKKAVKTVMKGYKNLVKEASLNPLLWKKQFHKSTGDYLDAFIAKGLGKEISQTEGKLIRQMFERGDLYKRPIHDITGAMVKRFGDTRFNRWAAHALKDAITFGMIDATFEGVRTIGENLEGHDYTYQLSAPLWGGINGLAFSSLAWMNPKGKASRWWPDFKAGVKTSMRVNPYKKMNKEQLIASAKFWGDNLKASGKDSMVKMKGKNIDLSSKTLSNKLEHEFGDGVESVLRKELGGIMRAEGRSMMKGISWDEAQNMFINLPRMTAGGLLFNAHSFYDMYMHEQKFTIHDILPHFLIGAWVQRKSNPAKMDLSSSKMNQLRKNMYIMGVDPAQMSAVPTFDGRENRLRNIYNDTKFEKNEKLAEDLGIITDNYELSTIPLPAVERSAATVKDPVFDILYEKLDGRRQFRKNKDDISHADAKKLVENALKLEPDLADPFKRDAVVGESYMKTTEAFEDTFGEILKEVEAADVNNETGIRTIAGKTEVPTHLDFEPLMSRAEKGELLWLKGEKGTANENNVLEGAEAKRALADMQDSFNTILAASRSIEKARVIDDTSLRSKTIEDENLANNIYQIVRMNERRINEMYPDRAAKSEDFSYARDRDDYLMMLIHNHSIKIADKTIQMFGTGVEKNERDRLVSLLTEAGILVNPDGGKTKIIDMVDNLIIKTGLEKDDPERKEVAAAAKRFLGNVLTLQSIVGREVYEGHVVNKKEMYIELGDINKLRKFLEGRNVNLDDIRPGQMENLTDFALRLAIEGSDLNIGQATALFSLSVHGISRFSTRTAGQAGGFRVKRINEGLSPDSDVAVKVNGLLQQMVTDSKGLVQFEGEMHIPNKNNLYAIRDLVTRGLTVSDGASHATKEILGVLQALHASSQTYTSFTEQMRGYVESNNLNAERLQTWLIQAGVLVPSKSGRPSEVAIEKLTELIKDKKDINGDELTIWKDISLKMDKTGWTADFVEAEYTKYEDRARDNRLRDTDESTYESGITINQFWKDYRLFDGINYSLETPEVQRIKMQELIYDSTGDRVLKLDVFEKVLDKIYVRQGSGWAKFNARGITQEAIDAGQAIILSGARRREIRSRTLEKLTGLFLQDNSQVKLKVLKYKNGQIEEDVETRLYSKMVNYIKKTLDIDYFVVDGRATIYEMVDGRYIRKQSVDIFGETPNISTASNEHIRDTRTNFERDLNLHMKETPGTGTEGTRGLVLMQVFPNMEPIAIEKNHLSNMRQHYLDFHEIYYNHADVSEPVKRQLRDLQTRVNESLSAEAPSEVSPDKYNHMLKLLLSEQMLTGNDGNSLFIKYLNNDTSVNVPKLMSYSRLFNSKSFAFIGQDYVLELADMYEKNGDVRVGGGIGANGRYQRGALRKFSTRRNGKGGFNGTVWNDVDFANLRLETEQHMRDLGITDAEWNWSQSIGDAHKKVTSYDSIMKVSRDMMMFAHTVVGHDPYSFTPIKPLINSNGANAPLLIGKTLLQYDAGLDPFFSLNPNVDFILARSGAKAYNSKEGEGVNDISLINKADFELNNHTVNPQQIREIPFEALGLKIEKDYYQHTAKEALADQNYTTNEESTRWFNDQYREQLNSNLNSIDAIMSDPIATREWMLRELEGDHTLSSNLVESQGLSHLNNMFFWLSLSRDANPMSFSDSVVKNKLYQIYIDKLLNSSRSITNQFSPEGSDRYGGQGILIQSVGSRLKGTFVDGNGKMLSRGEVEIPHHEAETNILNFMKDGIGLRFVIAGKKLDETSVGGDVFTGEQIFGKSYWKEIMDKAASGGITVGSLHSHVKEIARLTPELEGLSIAIALRRNPRTRPNDMTILGLKGFLDRTNGNSLAINSLDVANVFEGDYDVDKADYWFSHRDSFWSHVDRASQFYVQGIDPTDLITPEKFQWSDTSGKIVENVNRISANLNLYKSSIGRVQKIPRILSYIDKLGYETIKDNEFVLGYNKTFKDKKIMDNAKILLGGNSGVDKDKKPWADNHTVTFDYNNFEYFLRSALETQYIIDGKGDINPNISRSMETWSDDFLFPTIKNSVSPGQVKEGGATFINDIRSGGSSGGKRVRIFRRIERTIDGEYVEKELTPLDKAVVREIMQEYSNLLKVSRDYMYENTGEKARVSYEDIFDTAEQFFLFNRDLNSSLYYRLRKKVRDRTDPREAKWADDAEFQSAFGVESRTYQKFGKEKKYNVSTKKAVYSSVNDNGMGFYNGERGAPLDRVFQRLYDRDPFKRSRLREVTGDISGLMNNWYNELLGGADSEDVSKMSDRLNYQLKKGVLDYNKKVAVIGSMKKKLMQISNNYKIPFKTRKASVDKLNEAIGKIEKEIALLIPKKYWRTRKREDLTKMEFVDIDAESMHQGMIYATTMNTIRNALPGVREGRTFALDESGQQYLKELQAIRKAFYGNNTRLKEIYKYGAKNILTESQIELLRNFPELSTYYEIETKLLLDGYNSYGVQFIYNFMTPAENKYAMGVFNGKVQPVPYEATEKYDPGSRYRRGLRFLSQLAKGEFTDKLADPEDVGRTRDALHMFQFIEAQWERFYNRKVDLMKLISEGDSNLSDIRVKGMVSPAVMMAQKAGIFNQLKLPNVNKRVQKMFQSFKGIEWKGESEERIGHGRDLTNDHLLDFYNAIMQEAGKGKEFAEYRTMMNDIEAQMINNQIIDPIDYLSLRSMMDKNVMEIAKTVFTGGLTEESGKTKFVKNIMSNPAFILMGGESYFKGYSYEKSARRNLHERLRRNHKLSTDFDNYRNNINVRTSKAKEELEQLINECGG